MAVIRNSLARNEAKGICARLLLYYQANFQNDTFVTSLDHSGLHLKKPPFVHDSDWGRMLLLVPDSSRAEGRDINTVSKADINIR